MSQSAAAQEDFEFRDITLTEMMSYYSPPWLAWVGVLASVLTSTNLPCFGLVLSRYVFILSMPYEGWTEAEKENFNMIGGPKSN